MSTRYLPQFDCDECGERDIAEGKPISGTKDKHICHYCRRDRACRIFGHIPSTSEDRWPGLAGMYCTRCLADIPQEVGS